MEKITIELRRRVLNELLDERYETISELHNDREDALENFEMRKYRVAVAAIPKLEFEIDVLETLIEEQS
jgi:hypothetical protein